MVAPLKTFLKNFSSVFSDKFSQVPRAITQPNHINQW